MAAVAETSDEPHASTNGNHEVLQNGEASHDEQQGVKEEAESDDEDDVPLAARFAGVEKMETNDVEAGGSSPGEVKSEPEEEKPAVKQEMKRAHESDDDDDDDVSLAVRAQQMKKEEAEDDDDYVPGKKPAKRRKEDHGEKKEKHKKHKKDKHHHKKEKHDKKASTSTSSSSKSKKPAATPVKKEKKEVKEEEDTVWRWWEEDRGDGTIKWKFLEHQGVYFAPPYEPLPNSVRFKYEGKAMKLEPETEEAATFFGKMIDHEYTSKPAFRTNFFKDWRKIMSAEERGVITDLNKCDFREIDEHFKKKSEERKAMSKDEKNKIKEDNLKLVEEYGIAIVDGFKQRVGNFRVEPPSLFRGRGEHPKMGHIKKRVAPEDIMINCSKDSKIPAPPPGHKWKEVRHDNTVSWLASWNENIMGQVKYVMLNATSKMKGMKDYDKYEKARELNNCVETIREDYRNDWKSKEMRIRQRSVALYFIDKLALRAGNEKEEGETADTVGCCSLRVEHIKLHEEAEIEGIKRENVVDFDFLGKDSIRYFNRVEVEKRVFKNLKLFVENKEPGDDLFDRLNTTIMNKYLGSLMPGLSAKVFRTYNASHTLQEQLKAMTTPDILKSENELVLAYNRANRAVAVLCNHQRAPPKTHGQQMENMKLKINDKKHDVKEAKKARDDAKTDYKRNKSEKNKKTLDAKQKRYDTLKNQLAALEVKATDKEENKEISLGTSKLNYLDPRISVQWCLKYNVNINKVYNKTQREKFKWAIDMITKQHEDGEEFDF